MKRTQSLRPYEAYSTRQTAVGAVLAVALVVVPLVAVSAPVATAAALAVVGLGPRAVRTVGRWAAAPTVAESGETPDATPTKQKA